MMTPDQEHALATVQAEIDQAIARGTVAQERAEDDRHLAAAMRSLLRTAYVEYDRGGDPKYTLIDGEFTVTPEQREVMERVARDG